MSMVTNATERTNDPAPNGAAMAAVAAAGVGSFAMGAVVMLAEAGVWSAPALYAPTGGLSGRTACAVVVWLVMWAVLHARWRRRDINAARTLNVALALIALGAFGTFPPIWQLL